MQYIGSSARSGSMPYCASNATARSTASGCCRNASQAAGQSAGSSPVEGCASQPPRQVTDRSPRRLSVLSAFTCPAFGTPATMPYWACTSGSETVASILPRSSGRPAYRSKSGRMLETGTVDVEKATEDPARTGPLAGATGAPSRVTSCVQAPL